MGMAISLWVLLGSALGGLARYWLGVGVAALTGPRFPWGTLLINVVGSLIIGVFAAALGGSGLYRGLVDEDGRIGGVVDARAFVMVGLCGGFTTFSSFSLQALELLQSGRHGAALAYMGGSVLACLVAVWLGWVVGSGTWPAGQG